jgi:hypothetical protein
MKYVWFFLMTFSCQFLCSVLNAQSDFYGVSSPVSFAITREELPISKLQASIFIKNYVEKNIAEWQKKSEFEKTIDYQKRVSEQTRNLKAQELTNTAVKEYKMEYAKTVKWSEFELSQYDADNETYLIKSKQFGDFALPVPISEAQALKKSWETVRFQNSDFLIDGNAVSLAKVTILNPSNQKNYLYDSKRSTTYAANNITYNFDPIVVDFSSDNVSANNTKIETKSTTVGKDQVDINIPVSSKENTKSFALVIGNENYRNEIKVPFARNDATVFADYCKKTLGIPAKNLRLLIDGTYGQMLGEIKWIGDVIAAYKGEAKVIVFYAGHGMPGESDKNAFLLPTDGNSNITQSAVKLDDLYAGLSANPSQSVSVFLDACFSGAAREGSLTDGRGVKIMPKENVLSGNMVVFSATSADETALPIVENGHGLFTYFLLKKLQESQGNVTLQELSSYVTDNVKKQSVVVNNKAQNPKVNPSPALQNTWQNIKLK